MGTSWCTGGFSFTLLRSVGWRPNLRRWMVALIRLPPLGWGVGGFDRSHLSRPGDTRRRAFPPTASFRTHDVIRREGQFPPIARPSPPQHTQIPHEWGHAANRISRQYVVLSEYQNGLPHTDAKSQEIDYQVTTIYFGGFVANFQNNALV